MPSPTDAEKPENDQLVNADPRELFLFFLPPWVARHTYIGMYRPGTPSATSTIPWSTGASPDVQLSLPLTSKSQAEFVEYELEWRSHAGKLFDAAEASIIATTAVEVADVIPAAPSFSASFDTVVSLSGQPYIDEFEQASFRQGGAVD